MTNYERKREKERDKDRESVELWSKIVGKNLFRFDQILNEPT